MFIQQIYTNCLAQAAYYLQSGSEAAIIDPLRDPAPYLQLAAQRGATIKYVLETHFHADFVSGHLDLAQKTGAEIVFGPGAIPVYDAHISFDGELLPLGDEFIKVLHTPGHTVESVCFAVVDAMGKTSALFTGDTLFAGDVGRPDLLSANLPKETLAAMLYYSLQKNIKTLPDDVVVYPGHGPGSACGKNIGKNTVTTIGEQKATNYALLAPDKATFVKMVTTDLPGIPAYFFVGAVANRTGYEPFYSVLERSLQGITPSELIALTESGALVLDTRDAADFAAAFVPGALNVGLNGDFAVWVGTLVNAKTKLILVTNQGKEQEAIERLARIGFEQVAGYLMGGMESWRAAGMPVDAIPVLMAGQIAPMLAMGSLTLDVRNTREALNNCVTGAIQIPLGRLENECVGLNKNAPWLVYCAGGYRSMIAASLLKARGFAHITNIQGGMKAILEKEPIVVEALSDVDA